MKTHTLRPISLKSAMVASILLVTLTICVSLIWLRTAHFQDLTVPMIEEMVSHQTGEVLTLDRADVAFWPPGAKLSGIRLNHKDSGEIIFEAEKVWVPLVLRNRGIRIGRLRIVKPLIALHMEEDGSLREFQNRVQPDEPKPIQELPWYSVVIHDGLIQLHHPNGSLALEDLNIQPEGGPHSKIAVVAKGSWNDISFEESITLSHVVLGPDRLEIPDFNIKTHPFSLEFSGFHTLNGPVSARMSLEVHLDSLDGMFPPPTKFDGYLAADLEISGSMADYQLNTAILASQLRIQLPNKYRTSVSYGFGDVSVASRTTPLGTDIESLKMKWGDGMWTGTAQISPEGQLTNGQLSGEDLSLAHILHAFGAAPTPWVDTLMDAEFSFAGPLNPIHLTGEVDLVSKDFSVGDRPIKDPGVRLMLDIPSIWTRGTLNLESDHIQIDAPTLQTRNTQGAFSAHIGFGNRGPLDLRLDLWGADLSDFQPLGGARLGGTGSLSGRLHGPFNKLHFEGQGDIHQFEALGIGFADRLVTSIASPHMNSVELTDATAYVGRSSYKGDIDLHFKPPMSLFTKLTFSDSHIEDILGVFLDMEGIEGEMNGTLALNGPFKDLSGGSYFNLNDVRLFGEHFPVGQIQGVMDEGLFTLDDLHLNRGDGTETLKLSGQVVRDWQLDMNLKSEGLRLEHFDLFKTRNLPVSGTANLDIDIGNTLFDPYPRGAISLEDAFYGDFKMGESKVLLGTENDIITFAAVLADGALMVDGTQQLSGTQTYVLDAELDEFPLHMFRPTGADGSPLRAITDGVVRVDGQFGDDPSPVQLNGTFSQVHLDWTGHRLTNRMPWVLDLNGEAFSMNGFGLFGGKTDVQFSATGGDGLQVNGDGIVDLDLMRIVVPGLQKAEGIGDISISAIGKRPNVEAAIDIDIDAPLLRYQAIPAAMEDIQAHARITADSIEFSNLDGSLGGGQLEGGGRIECEAWKPKRYDLYANVRDGQVQWTESLAPARGDATLTFDGPVDELLLSGNVNIHDMTFADRIDWEDWVIAYRNSIDVEKAIKEEEALFNLDVTLEADQSIRLNNNVANAVGSADLRIIGDSVRPGMVGQAQIHRGSAFIQDREFQFERGNLAFNDPWTWDPELDFDLSTTIESRDQRYDINYLIMGPFSDWRTATRTDPALPQSDVNALLWFGVTMDDLEEMGDLASAVGQGVADLIISDLLLSTQMGDLGDELPRLVDRMELMTGVSTRGEYSPDPRLLLQKRLRDLGDIELSWEFNLARTEDQFFKIDKRISGIWSLSGWYATLQRDRVIPIGGAYGVDISARWESE